MYRTILQKLNLIEQDIESIVPVQSDNGDTHYLLTLKKTEHICPFCGSMTSRVKDYHQRKIRSRIFIDSNTIVFYNCRRYFCPHCGRSFVERHPFSGGRHVVSPTTVHHVLIDLKPYNATFSSVAKKYGLSVPTVIDIFDKHVQIPPKQLPEVMCWDEFYFNRHSKYKYAFLILNFSNSLIIDILESRKTPFLSDYFYSIPISQRSRVKFIIIDMYEHYRRISQIYFPGALLCTDPFHVVKNLNDSLNRVRKTVMAAWSRDKGSQEYRLLKYRRHYLFRHRAQLDYIHTRFDCILGYHTTDRNLVDIILKIDNRLSMAYAIKEDYMEFNEETEESFPGREKKEKRLDQLIMKCLASELSPMISFGRMLASWKEEILNSFTWINGKRASNGPIEGKNSYIKKILSNANGFSNFKRARNRIIYSQNRYEKYSIHEHDKSVKRKGKARGKYKK